MRLVNEEGVEVKLGDTITDFRGRDWRITGWQEPENSASTGRVRVEPLNAELDWRGVSEFYPSVFKLEWRA